MLRDGNWPPQAYFPCCKFHADDKTLLYDLLAPPGVHCTFGIFSLACAFGLDRCPLRPALGEIVSLLPPAGPIPPTELAGSHSHSPNSLRAPFVAPQAEPLVHSDSVSTSSYSDSEMESVRHHWRDLVLRTVTRHCPDYHHPLPLNCSCLPSSPLDDERRLTGEVLHGFESTPSPPQLS